MLTVERFTDQYELAAQLYGRTPADLRRRDCSLAQPLQRWLAIQDGTVIGAVTTGNRPDDRLFLRFACRELSAYPPLLELIDDKYQRPVFADVDAGDRDVLAMFTRAGFEVEVSFERFRVRFDRALAMVRRGRVPAGFSIRSADVADEDRLFALDNLLRGGIPGMEGWKGDRQMFRDEIAESPPFDPSSYLVAIDRHSDDYVGLVRIWRNPDGPRFGLIGVIPEYRHTLIGAALLNQALTAASGWGYETFIGETGLDNQATYPRLKRIGAESLGQFHQLVRR